MQMYKWQHSCESASHGKRKAMQSCVAQSAMQNMMLLGEALLMTKK